jgi:hypothetical protein
MLEINIDNSEKSEELFISSMFGGLGSGSGVRYYCMSCGAKHNEIACPKCGSKMKRVGS